MTYDIAIRVKIGSDVPKLFDWIAENISEYNELWTYERSYGFGVRDYVNYTFKFTRSKDATLFALRWS